MGHVAQAAGSERTKAGSFDICYSLKELQNESQAGLSKPPAAVVGTGGFFILRRLSNPAEVVGLMGTGHSPQH